MASLSTTSLLPSFTNIKPKITNSPPTSSSITLPKPNILTKFPLKQVGSAAVATALATILSGNNALAVDILLGADDGSLAFVPKEFIVSSGDKIVFKNNAGFPHNVVFDEDEIPSGVDASAISMSEENLLNAPGETFSVTLTEKGSYTFYCSPHQGAGMVGKVTVK